MFKEASPAPIDTVTRSLEVKDYETIFIALSRSSVAKIPMKTKMITLLFPTVMLQRFIRSMVILRSRIFRQSGAVS